MFSSKTDRRLEELEMHFDRFLNLKEPHQIEKPPSKEYENRLKFVEDRCDLINSKLDKGLLIL